MLLSAPIGDQILAQGRENEIMEELELQEERVGLFGRIKGIFGREEYDVEEEDVIEEARQTTVATPTYRLHTARNYNVSVRRQIQSFQDAVAAADGLKRGDAQIMNLTGCGTELREKIKDFMCGVNYAHEGSWEELGENIYLLAPPHANIEVAPATPKMAAAKN